MKAIYLLLLGLFFSTFLFSQENEKMKSDTTKIKIGHNTILIIGPNSEDMEIVAKDDDDDDDNGTTTKKFKGHWGGVDLGLNNYLTSDYSTTLPTHYGYLDLNTGKSWEVGLNLLEQNITLKKNVGLVTGLGFEFNNYRFNKDYTLMNDSSELYAVESYVPLQKSKLVTSYLTVPLIFEVQFPANQKKSKRAHIGIGAIGGIKIGSHAKYVEDISGDRHIYKERQDFHLNPFRYGATLRIGYRGINLYANYNLSTLFEKNQGLELYPISLGISIVGF